MSIYATWRVASVSKNEAEKTVGRNHVQLGRGDVAHDEAGRIKVDLILRATEWV